MQCTLPLICSFSLRVAAASEWEQVCYKMQSVTFPIKHRS